MTAKAALIYRHIWRNLGILFGFLAFFITSIKERQTPKHGRSNPKAMFEELSTMAASCIMLDSVWHEIRGNAERIFPEFINHFESALEDFCDRH